MPLKEGSSHEVVGENIKTEMAHGKPQAQAVAIALKEAGLSNQDTAKDAGPLNPADVSAAPLPDPGDPLPQPAGPNALPRPAASTMGGGYDAEPASRLPGQVSAADVFAANRIRDRSW
jgi:hypothetical protein